ncbi:hypothetical protein BP6252_07611 [Coleophoma cylindrospora]|uniref:Uncharacterized protein n=1 Tax=Coleophoma cylindrospora TaxID=1849047 RepID=A0A3D8RAV1_9HELO|nr:hypothetical protein BP6252_07611 [Coleophoma cylindrospora]
MPSWGLHVHRKKPLKTSNAVERRENPTGYEDNIIDKREADSEGSIATTGEAGDSVQNPGVHPRTLTPFRDGKPDGLRINPVTQADLPHRSRLPPSAATSDDMSSGDNREGPRIPSIIITSAEEDEDEPQEIVDGNGKEHNYSGKGKGKERATDKPPIRSQARYRPRPQPQHRAQSSQQAAAPQSQVGIQQGYQHYSENTQSPRPEPSPLRFNGRYPIEHYSGGPRISPYGAMPVHVRYDGPFMQVLPAMHPYQSQHGGLAQSAAHGMMQSGYAGQQGYQAPFMTPQDSNSSSSYQPDSRTQQRVENIMGPASMGTYQDQRRFEIAAQSASTLQRQVTFPDVNRAGTSPQSTQSYPKTHDHVSDQPVHRRNGYPVQPAMMSGGLGLEAGASPSNASAARLPNSSQQPQRRQASSSPLRHANMPLSGAPLTATSHRPASRSPLHRQTNLQVLEEESAEPVMTTLQPMNSMRTMTEEVEGPKLAKKFSIKDLFGRAIAVRKKEDRVAAARMEEEE